MAVLGMNPLQPVSSVLKSLRLAEPKQPAHLPFQKPAYFLPSQHPAAVYVARMGTHQSRVSVRGKLDQLAMILSVGKQTAETLPWHELRYQHTAALRSVLAERYKSNTVNTLLSTVRGVLLECWRLGLMDSDSYERARQIKNVKAETLPVGRALSQGEVRTLFEYCAEDPKPRGRRGAAIIALLYGLGLRRFEATTLQVGDYNRENHQLMIRRGKGLKDRIVHAGPGAAEALDDYLEARGADPGPFLVATRRGGRLFSKPITSQAIYCWLAETAQKAGVDRFTPHDLRRTYIGELLDAGADLSIVRSLAGHSSVNTTARYDRRGEREKARAAALLPVPYVRRRQLQNAKIGPSAVPGDQADQGEEGT